MRILLDECLNWRLGRAFVGHEVTSVQRMNWSGVKNGELLALMVKEQFDIFVTGDRNMQFQQYLPHVPVAFVVLGAKTTKLDDKLPLISKVLTLLPTLQRGTVTVISE